MNEEVLVTGLGSGGDGVGRLENGRVVFIAGALPGDRIRVELGAGDKGPARAQSFELIEPSTDRVDGACTVADCGGCGWRDYASSAQLAGKQQRLEQALKRIGKLDATVDQVHVSPEEWRYRHRVRLHGEHDGRRWRLGYHRRGSRTLVPLEGCPVLWPELHEAALGLADQIQSLPRSVGVEEVEVVASRRSGAAAALIRSKRPLDPAALRGTLAGLAAEARGRRQVAGAVELTYDHAPDVELNFEVGAFTQANPAVNRVLVERVVELIPEGDVREFHAGIGNFTVPLAKAGARVAALEVNPLAVQANRLNLRRAGVRADVLQASDHEALDGLSRCHAVLLDPPRGGAAKVAAALARRGPKQVLYVSCDPATLARDAATLVAGGYALTRLEMLDMFPQTPHVEAVAVFQK